MIKTLFLVLILLSLINLSHANDFGVVINQANLQTVDNEWRGNAQINFQLSEIARQALHSSIPLVWNLQIKLNKPRRYLWDETFFKKNIRLKIRYHSLLKLYQIHQGSKEVESYRQLNTALQHLGQITAIKLNHNFALSTVSDYKISMVLYFDKEALPLPLRPEAYFKADWSLSSKTYSWRVTK